MSLKRLIQPILRQTSGSVRSRLMVLFALLSILPVCLISILGYRMTRGIVEKQVAQSLSLQTSLAREEIYRYLENTQSVLSPLYQAGSHLHHRLETLLRAHQNPARDPALAQWFSVLQQTGYFHGLWVTDRALRPVFSFGSDSLPLRLSDLPREAEAHFLPLPAGSGSSPHRLICVHPLGTSPEAPAGYLVGLVRLEPLLEHLKKLIQENEGSKVFLLQKSGTLIFCTDPAGRINLRAAAPSSGALKPALVAIDGQTVYQLAQPLGILDWQVVSQVPFQAAMAPVLHFRTQVVMGMSLMLLLLLGLAFTVSKHFTRPIEQLASLAHQIGQGNLSVPIRLNRADELGVLAGELETMRQSLQAYTENLEKMVAERTEALRKAQHQIIHQEKMASLGLMAAGIAHEIGNPLTAISSLVQMLKRRTEDPRTAKELNTVLEHIQRISRIVRELVDFSRTGSGQLRQTYVNEIIASTVGILKYDRRARDVQFALDLARELPVLELVPDELQQVLFNILVNALDAMENTEKKIFIRSYVKDGRIHIEIRDTGVGIPREHLQRIFEPFFTTKEVGKGTGLGLSVSYGIVRKFGGDILVQSQPGKGSTFTIVLPANRKEEPVHG